MRYQRADELVSRGERGPDQPNVAPPPQAGARVLSGHAAPAAPVTRGILGAIVVLSPDPLVGGVFALTARRSCAAPDALGVERRRCQRRAFHHWCGRAHRRRRHRGVGARPAQDQSLDVVRSCYGWASLDARRSVVSSEPAGWPLLARAFGHRGVTSAAIEVCGALRPGLHPQITLYGIFTTCDLNPPPGSALRERRARHVGPVRQESAADARIPTDL